MCFEFKNQRRCLLRVSQIQRQENDDSAGRGHFGARAGRGVVYEYDARPAAQYRPAVCRGADNLSGCFAGNGRAGAKPPDPGTNGYARSY